MRREYVGMHLGDVDDDVHDCPQQIGELGVLQHRLDVGHDDLKRSGTNEEHYDRGINEYGQIKANANHDEFVDAGFVSVQQQSLEQRGQFSIPAKRLE